MARIILATVPTTTTPDEGQLSIYAKPDLTLYTKDENGTEKQILTSASPDDRGYEVAYITISPEQAVAKQIQLSTLPTRPERTLLDVVGAGAQMYSLDFNVVGDILSWSGGRLDGILDEGDEIRVVWF